jgi:hypothetical protein
MKNHTASILFALAGLLAASQPVLAATTKPDVRAAALVSALQAVSPDPLGGRLGLAAATVLTPALEKDLPGQDYAAQIQRAKLDQRSYLIWKSSQKS